MRMVRLCSLLLAVAALLPADELLARRALHRFASGEQWRVHGAGAGIASLTIGEDEGTLVLQPTDKEVHIPLTERKFGITRLEHVERLELVAELVSGSGVRFNIRLRDPDGEVGQLATQTLEPGENILSWEVPPDRRFKGTWGATEEKRNGVLELPLQLHELFLVRGVADQPAEIVLRELRVVNRSTPAEAIEVELVAGNDIHVLTPTEPDGPVLVLRSVADVPVRVAARVRLTDFAGRVHHQARMIEIPAGEIAHLPLSRPVDQGIFYVDYELTDAGGNRKEGRRSFAVMDPAGPTPARAEGFLFSICTHTERWSEADQRLEVLAAGLCGAKVIRTGVGWGGIEPVEGEFRWDHMDRILAMYGEQGMEIQYLLGFCPRWAAAPERRDAAEWRDWGFSNPREDAWRRWVREMAKRYGDRIRYWEVWNEPDISFWRGTLDEYLDLLRAAHEEIKAVNPELQVMTGGFAIYNRNPDFIEGVVARGQAWFDIFAHHRHGNFRGFQAEVDGPIAALRAKLEPPRPIYFNETAIASIGIGERGQAETLVKKLAFAWARGAMGYTWYDLRNDGFDPQDYEHNYGMMTNDFYPKAVYPAYNTLVRLLRGKEFVRQLDLGEDRWGFVFADDAESVVVAWNESRSEMDEHYLLATGPLRAASLVDLMNNARALPLGGADRLSMPLSSTPRYLRIPGRHPDLRVLGPELKLESVAPAVPGKTARAVLAIHNHHAETREFVAAWQLPEEWGGTSGETTLAIPAGTPGRLELDLPIPAALRGRYGTALPVAATVALRGQQPFARFAMPVPLAAFVPGDSAEPVFRLAEHSRVTKLFEADPNRKHLVWTGPDDLAVDASLRRTETHLEIDFAVRDDIHHQPNQGAEMWQGDGIQLAFAVPGQDGFWEIGLGRSNAGESLVHVWHRPKGFANPVAQIGLTTEIQPGGLLYRARLPLAACGLTAETLQAGIRLSFLVNDNDGEGRESWIELSEGIGRRKEPARFPFLVFE